MSSCITDTCGTGDWTGPLPGDPDNNSILSAVPTFGGIDVSWTYPNINPHAVAHVLLYRGISSNYAASVKQATVSGNTFYDKITGTAGTRYYYWIQIVSVNGTVGAAIGPASAVNRGRIEDLIADLSGKLEESELGLSLRSTLGDITSNYDELVGRIGEFSGNNQAFMDALADVQSGLTGALTLLNTEITQRTSGQNALLSQQTVLAALNQVNVAAILEEQTVRVNAESALAQTVSDLGVANTAGIAAAVKTLGSSKIGYSGKATTEEPYEGNNSFVVYPATTYPTATYPDYALNRNRIIDKQGVDNWNAVNALELVWVVGLPLAQAIKSVGISDGVTSLTVEQRATAQKTTNGNLLAQYTVKIDSGGYITGYGLASTVVDGTPTSSFKINADYFSIAGPTVPGQTRPVLSPFIVDTVNNTVLMNNAMIKRLTADNIDTKGLVIRDNEGNPIFGAGYPLSWGSIGNKPVLGALASQDYAVMGGASKTVGIWDAAQNKYDYLEPTDFVNKLSKIGSGNIGTFMDGAAITSAYIGNAEIKNANIENLSVDTLKIANQSATILTSNRDPGSTVSVVVSIPYAAEVQLIGTGALPETSDIFIDYRSSGGAWVNLTSERINQFTTAILAYKVGLGAGIWEFRFRAPTGGVRTSIIVFVSMK